MNKEEKEAIWHCVSILANNKNDLEHWKIVENYIEKLQLGIDKLEKENEELYQENKSLKKEIKLMKSVNINKNFISKDEIRNKIKELEEHLKDINDNVPKRKDGTPNRNINSGCRHYYEYKIEVLEEFLGGDE